MDRDDIKKRVQALRDEVDFVVRQNEAFDANQKHTALDRQLHTARMERLQAITIELADIKAGKIA